MNAPPPITSRVPLANACGVAHVGGFAYVACKEEGVFGVDLKNPAAPVVKGSLAAPGMDARRLSTSGDGRLYVAAFGGGLHVYDIRNPNHPLPIAHVSSALIPYVENVLAWGGFAFVVGGDGVNARFAVIDLRVAQPRILGAFTLVTAETTNYMSVGFDGRYAYVGTTKGEVHVLDVSDLGRIARVGEYFCPRHDFRPPMVSGIVAFPGRLFVCDWGAGLVALDTRNPGNPRQYGIFQGGTHAANAYHVAVEGNVAYLANGWGGLVAVDISNPVSMRLLYEIVPQQASFVDVAMAGPLALIANNGAPQGLEIVRLK